MNKLFRWKAIVPLLLLLLLLGGTVLLFLDGLVRRGVEAVGSEFVGAKVDVGEADIRLGDGFVRLGSIAVTNPDAPMTNLFEAEEVVADVRMLPLTEKKVFIDTVAIRGVRFGTARETSGALDRPSRTHQIIRARWSQWADNIRIPEFSLAGLSGAIDVAAIRPESLQTRAVALGLVAETDSARAVWEGRLRSLDPRPTIDSARALAARLAGASLASLGIRGVANSVRDVRASLQGVNSSLSRISAFEQDLRVGVESLDDRVAALAEAQAADVRRALAMVQIPSLDAPDLSPSLFGAFALEKVEPILRWLDLVSRYVPPGLDPRRRPGPTRARMAGETVAFPKAGALPTFTVAHGDASLSIGGQGAAAGRYEAQISGLTSAPSLLGSPLTVTARRADATRGARDLRVAAVIDHVTPTIRDSVDLAVSGVSLPSIALAGLGATMDLGTGSSELSLARVGNDIVGRWAWRSDDVTWSRLPGGASNVSGRIGDFLWGAVSGLTNVEVDVRIRGSADGPSLAIRSNVGTEIARSLRRQLQTEIDAAETRVRSEIARLVAQPIADARGRVAGLESELQDQVAGYKAELEQVKADLESRLRSLTP